MDHGILLQNGLIEIPGEPVSEVLRLSSIAGTATDLALVQKIATLVSNLAKFGYTLDQEALACLAGTDDLATWWQPVQAALAKITGSARGMDRFVVYKNFPREVLEMDRATYVFQQLLIYWGVPSESLAEKEKARPPLGEMSRLKVLKRADADAEARIMRDLVSMPNRWSDNQIAWAKTLVRPRNAIVAGDFGFKENAILVAAENFATMEFVPSSATDVLKLAFALSGADDLSLRTSSKLRGFKRAERTRLLTYLSGQANLGADAAERPELWKRLFERLHPGDYKQFPLVTQAYDDLYNKRVRSQEAVLNPRKLTVATLLAAQARPGMFLRRFRQYYASLPAETVQHLLPVLDKLSTRKLVAFGAYLRTVNTRRTMMYAPRGHWSKVQVMPNTGPKIARDDIRRLQARIGEIVGARLDAAYPEGFALDLRVDAVKLQTNDQKLAEYGRGSEFDIPPQMTFLRSASYWQQDPKRGYTWFDNGWNFFDEHWKPLGVCAWNTGSFGAGRGKNGNAAIFSGDPVNAKELKGRACQMIDLYIDRLQAQGVRYAVWCILCYSGQKFSEAKEVLATFQWGEQPEHGKLYEPARAQMVFPLKSETLVSYIAYVDLVRRKLVYMDAPLPSKRGSASANEGILAEMMPAYIEYMEALPTVLELLQDARQGSIPLLYDDAHTRLAGGPAYVFRPLNAESQYAPITLAELMAV